MESTIILLIILGVFGLLSLAIVVICKILDKQQRIKELENHVKYPEFFKMHQKIYLMRVDNSHNRTKQIKIEEKINKLLSQFQYLPKDSDKYYELEVELETLRDEYEEVTIAYDQLARKIKLACSLIKLKPMPDEYKDGYNYTE